MQLDDVIALLIEFLDVFFRKILLMQADNNKNDVVEGLKAFDGSGLGWTLPLISSKTTIKKHDKIRSKLESAARL